MSPRLYNVYMDDLSKELTSSRIGRKVRGNLINHLCYADALTLISLYSAGMEKLVAICSRYDIEHELVYNSIKSKVLRFKLKQISLR